MKFLRESKKRFKNANLAGSNLEWYQPHRTHDLLAKVHMN